MYGNQLQINQLIETSHDYNSQLSNTTHCAGHWGNAPQTVTLKVFNDGKGECYCVHIKNPPKTNSNKTKTNQQQKT